MPNCLDACRKAVRLGRRKLGPGAAIVVLSGLMGAAPAPRAQTSGFLEAVGRPAAKSPERAVAVERRATEPQGEGRRWAVLVGVNKYLDPAIPSLRYCVADARLLQKTLVEDCGYEADRVLLLTDDQAEDHLQPLEINFRHQIRLWLLKAAAGDTVLVSFSGHGFLDARGQSFLAPKDCEKSNLALRGFRTDDLRDMLHQCKATQKLLLLDCCHAGSDRAAGDDLPSSQEVGAAFQGAAGLITLASCDKNEKSQEWDAHGQGLFTYFVSRGLRGAADYDRNGLIDAYELHRYTLDQVPQTAQTRLNKVQTPKLLQGDDVKGVFVLARVTTKARPIEDIRRVKARFAVRQKLESGPPLPGAAVGLWYRAKEGTAPECLATGETDSQGQAILDVRLDGSQQTGGEFRVQVQRGQQKKHWELAGFPGVQAWTLAMPAPPSATIRDAPAALVNSIGMRLVRIPAGEFAMGTRESPELLATAYQVFDAKPDDFRDEHPEHRVRISRAFYMGACEVTVGQFRYFVTTTRYRTEAERSTSGGSGFDIIRSEFVSRPEYTWLNPGFEQGADYPVVLVTWNDASEFCRWLSKKEGEKYRLPREAEWEYACRAGTSTRFSCGDDLQALLEVANLADAMAPLKRTSRKATLGPDGHIFTAPVGRYRANAFGLHDMHGNVWEWCADWYQPDAYAKAEGADPKGPPFGSVRVTRGGGWTSPPQKCRSSVRSGNYPDLRCSYFGFRVVRD